MMDDLRTNRRHELTCSPSIGEVDLYLLDVTSSPRCIRRRASVGADYAPPSLRIPFDQKAPGKAGSTRDQNCVSYGRWISSAVTYLTATS